MSLARATLTTFLLLPTAAPAAAQGKDIGAQVAAVVAGASVARDVPRAAHELAGLGASALPVVMQRLANPGLELRERTILLAALAELPRAQIVEHLATLSRSSPDESQRRAGLELLGRLGTRAELGLVLELGRSSEADAPPGAELCEALERALAGICEREPAAARAMAEQFPRVGPAARNSIASVLCRLRSDDATGLLAGLLGSVDESADSMLLLALVSVPDRTYAEDDLLVFERVRECFGRPESGLVVLACAAANALGDHGAVPDLIMLLEHTNTNVRRAAHVSLRGLTGLTYAAEAEPWLAWLDESLAWWDERADDCRVALVSGPPAEAAAALAECAHQRLFAHDVAKMLALVVQRPEPDLVRAACRAFRALPPRTALAALGALRAHPDPAVTECARAALERARTEPRVAQRRPPTLPRTNGRTQ
jgi:hypothetical protein